MMVSSMPEIEFIDNQVLIRIPKALLVFTTRELLQVLPRLPLHWSEALIPVLTKAELLKALKCGKAYRRREQRAKRETIRP